MEGLVVDPMRGEGLRSRTCDRWSTMREVMVSGLRKEVVRSAVKMAVRWRSPCPWETSQKRAMQWLSASVA